MFLRAGAISLALLLASRLLGLLRESAQAAAFGTSGVADLVVLMLTLPDWITGLVASGAMAYVLLPAWAGASPAHVRALQRRVAMWVLACGVLAGLAMLLARAPLAAWLAPGTAGAVGAGSRALAWSALALPPALLAALWGARLQHERDFVGVYASNLVVNAVLVGAIACAGMAGARIVGWVGAGLLLAMLARLGWQWLRMRRRDTAAAARQAIAGAGVDSIAGKSAAPGSRLRGVWIAAILSAGLPLALPFAARSIASSGGGEGALATFNYAWKLVELPLVLAIQLVATIAFPAVAAAVQAGLDRPQAQRPLRHAYALAWGCACAAAAVLLVAAPAIASLLFGWGRMPGGSLETIAQWARIGAWGLLPQALAAVALTVLASQRRMAASAALYGAALALLGACALAGVRQGEALMLLLNLLYTAVAAGLLAAAGRNAWGALPWRAMAWPFAALLAAWGLRAWTG